MDKALEQLIEHYSANKAQENEIVTPITSYEHGAYKENRYGYQTNQRYWHRVECIFVSI